MKGLNLLAIGLVICFCGCSEGEAFREIEISNEIIASWFAEAKALDKGLWITNSSGCLFTISQVDDHPVIIQLLDANKQPICNSATYQKEASKISYVYCGFSELMRTPA